MGIRQDFERRIAKKNQEIAELELQIRDARTYVQALQDSLKMIPRDSANPATSDAALRPGSSVAKAYEAIKKLGRPLHVNEILEALGKPVNKKNRVSLAGSLAAYARKNEFFTRTAPNTFGLSESEPSTNGELPDSFGTV